MRVALLGDIALFGQNTVAIGTYKSRMAAVKEILDGCDYVVGNLETPLTNATKVVGGKSAYIKGSPEDVEILKWLGVTHVSLANNHMFDYKEQGLTDTIRCLESCGIDWYGTNGKSAYIKIENESIALHGYCCYSTNAKGLERGEPYVNVLDPHTMESDLSDDASVRAYPILSCHWGQEHVHYPNYDHVELARRIVAGRQAVIHGHHPHVIQGLERVGDALIAYSLGNFCFDDVYTNKSSEPLVRLSEDNQEVLVIVLDIENGSLSSYAKFVYSFVGGDYKFETSSSSRLREWSEFLSTGKAEYVATRNRDLNRYLASRKSLRDLKWYTSRLNFESLRMIMSAKKNASRYSRIVGDYVRGTDAQ